MISCRKRMLAKIKKKDNIILLKNKLKFSQYFKKLCYELKDMRCLVHCSYEQ